MDHAIYAYSALPGRPAYRWPGGSGLASYAVLFLEHWDLLPPAGSLRDPRMVGEFGSFTPDYRSWSQREYGLRVGIFRVIDALRASGVRPVIAANALALERLPGLVALFQDWGCEWLAHGVAATRMMHSDMTQDEQRQHIADSIAALAHATGVQPLGWLSQDWGTTPDTPQLLADAGIRYTLDWCHDDQPGWLHTTPALLSVPLSAEWDDVQCQWLRQITPRDHADLTVAAFDQLHRECALHQRAAVFGLALHPWLCGMPSRIAALRSLLARLRAYPDVHWTTPGALFQHSPGSSPLELP